MNFGKPKKIEIIADFGRQVFCDSCNGEWTERPESGGFLFGSKAYCPECEPDALDRIIEYDEQHFIKGHCPPSKSYADWCRNLRGGDNTVKLITY